MKRKAEDERHKRRDNGIPRIERPGNRRSIPIDVDRVFFRSTDRRLNELELEQKEESIIREYDTGILRFEDASRMLTALNRSTSRLNEMELERKEEFARLQLADVLRTRRSINMTGGIFVPSPVDLFEQKQPPPIIRNSVIMANRRLTEAPPLDEIKNEIKDVTMGIPVPTDVDVVPVEANNISLPCVICMTNQIQTVNFPCMHACFCVACAAPSTVHSNVCPICRVQYMHISMLYLQYKESNPVV